MRSMRLPSISFRCVAAAATLSVFNLQSLNAQTPKLEAAAGQVQTAAAKRVVTLDPLTDEEAGAPSMVELTKTVQRVPENFRQFDAVSKGQIGDTQTLTLRFAAGAKLLTIQSTPDFKVEQGGSCVESFTYSAKATCTLLVRSTPQGPGRRLGKVEITNSADAKPLLVGLGGNSYAPTISFTPSIISTVPGTYVSGAGLISNASNLAVDGGDTLYIADTGNSTLRFIDSSGVINSLAPSLVNSTVPVGVTVDAIGAVYATQQASDFLNVRVNAYQSAEYYTGSTGCEIGSTCPLEENADVDYGIISALAVDPNGTVFMNIGDEAAQLIPSMTVFNLDFIPLYTPGNYNDVYANPAPLAVDGSDTLYTYANYDGSCSINGMPYSDAFSGIDAPVVVAGGFTCGFSGDGGKAKGAEIGEELGQMYFDIAGNFYFTDTLNQRVRRIDNSTGIITTIAGNGAPGYSGDGGAATSATLDMPSGVAVDSQGQVYIISRSATTGTAQVVRKVGVIGALNLGGFAVGTSSTAQTVQVANTGNSELDFTHVGFSSGNTSDFVIDPNTTSCNFTVPLYAGRDCKIGFIFTPGATGNRSAVLSITDDTIAGVNTIQLSGAGYTTATLTPASFSYASTPVGSPSASQTATLTNTGKVVMTISSIVLSGTGATSYSETTTCGTTLAVGASCPISVVFKPTTTGTLTATLTVNDNALGGHQTVAVTGVGVAAAAKPVLAPTSLTFASQAVGSTSAAQTNKLSNSGTAALGVASIKLAGANAGDFVTSNNCGTSVAAGGSCTISVSFKPTATGTRSASVSVMTSNGTLTAGLNGTAVAASVKTNVVLTSKANPMPAHHTLVVTVQVQASSTAVPTGTVRLMEGTKLWSEGALKEGKVEMEVIGLPVGIHMMCAIYTGDNYTSNATSRALRQVVVSTLSGAPVFPRLGAADKEVIPSKP